MVSLILSDVHGSGWIEINVLKMVIKDALNEMFIS